jgi:hypothetical protein
VPTNDRVATGGAKERGQNRDGRRLAGTVGAEEAKDLALLDVERDTFDGGKVTVLFNQVVNLKDEGYGALLPKSFVIRIVSQEIIRQNLHKRKHLPHAD